MAAMNQTVFTYQMPHTKPEVIRTAHAFYEIAEKDGTCYSFPWIIWEGFQDKWRNATSEECKNIALEIERETSEKAHSTFIKLAFLPDNKILTGINLQNQIINYQSFVVAVPKFWSESFQNCKYILKEITECHEVAIGLRKTADEFDYFTIMCRGTLEACRKLQSFLTPSIEEDFNISIADMKVRKIQTMMDLLQDVFEFLPR
uniref:DUF7636 domain-containing protein n=1 Tax=Panagrolaimus davidi TaxID=227884 RepID=A0A914PNJ1_9BILA